MSASDKHIPGYVRLFIASVAGTVVSFVTHPFDLIKNRMQVATKGELRTQYKTSMNAINTIVKNDGILGLYTGLSASLLRQMSVTSTRLGTYSIMTDAFTGEDGTPPSLWVQFLSGLISGALGGIVGNPPDVILVRMTVDGVLPVKERHEYKNPFKALKDLLKNEKITGLWLGGEPATIRCMVLNVTQVVFYKNIKSMLLKTEKFEEDLFLHLFCGFCTAIVSSAATAPYDIIKTRMMSLSSNNEPEYSGIIRSWQKIIKNEGFFALWRGFTPTLGRNLPNNIVIFLVLEAMTKFYKQYVLGDVSNSGF